MSRTIVELPAVQLTPLERLYADGVATRRRHTIGACVILAVCILLSCWAGEVRPGVFLANAHRLTDYFAAIRPALHAASLPADLAEWFWNWDGWLALLFETVLIAYVGTLAGAIGAVLLCFLASANLVRSRVLCFTARRLLEFLRTVPEIVFALLFVVAFGLGPLPGVLALALHTMGALGKLFAEVVENIDMKPVDGAMAAGASWPLMVRFAVLPQVLSNFASYTLLRFEINVREAAIMGFVGAGGIGQDLLEAIRKFYYADVSAILVLIIATVMLIDLVSERIRHAFLSREAGR